MSIAHGFWFVAAGAPRLRTAPSADGRPRGEVNGDHVREPTWLERIDLKCGEPRTDVRAAGPARMPSIWIPIAAMGAMSNVRCWTVTIAFTCEASNSTRALWQRRSGPPANVHPPCWCAPSADCRAPFMAPSESLVAQAVSCATMALPSSQTFSREM